MKKVFLVILNYKGHQNTFDLLDSLKKIDQSKFELHTVVVDNCPSDPIKIEISDFKELKLEVIFNEKNLGFSGGNNVGIKYALENGADYVVIQNNDTLVHKNYLEEMVRLAEEKELAGAIVPKIYFAKGFEFHNSKYDENDLGKVFWYAGGSVDWKNVLGKHRGVDEVDKGQYDEMVETELATGCCVLLTRKSLEKVGGYDDRYFLYYEDADLSKRLLVAEFKIYYCPKATIWHKNAQSTGGSGSDLQDYFISRNRMLFGTRFAGIRARTALMRESGRLILKGRKWQRRGILDFYLRRFGRGSYPLG